MVIAPSAMALMVIAPSAMALVSSETTADVGATMQSAQTGGMPTLGSVKWTSIQGTLDDRLARLGRWGAVHRIADRASEARDAPALVPLWVGWVGIRWAAASELAAPPVVRAGAARVSAVRPCLSGELAMRAC